MTAHTAGGVLIGVGLAFVVGPAGMLSSSEAQGRGSVNCPSSSGPALVQTVRLAGRPRFLLLRKNTLWVAIAASRPGLEGGRGAIARVDARSGRVLRTFPLPVDPYRLASGFGSLWITGETNARRYRGVLRVDPSTGRLLTVIHGPKSVGAAIATTSAAVWVGGADVFPKGHPDRAGVRFVYEIDPRRNAVVREVQLAATTVIDLLGDGDFLWATGWGAVVKLSPSGRLLFEHRFAGSGWSMALTSGAVWVAQPWFGDRRERRQDRPARRLLKVATSGRRRLTVVELDSQPGGVSAAGDVVWIGSSSSLGRIDATATPPTLTRIDADVVPNRMEAFLGGVWLAELNRNELSKIC